MHTSLILWLIKLHVEIRFEQNDIQDCWKYGWNSHLRCSNNVPSLERRHLLPPCTPTTGTSQPHIISSSRTLPLCGSSSRANLILEFAKLLILLLHNALLVQQVQPRKHGIRRLPELVQGGKGANRSTSVVLCNLKIRYPFQALAIFNTCL